MFNQSFEQVIGRHGLVSDGFLLWKVGVKNVYNESEKLVETFPHIPHNPTHMFNPIRLLPRTRQSSGWFTQDTNTDLSTYKKNESTDTKLGLSPQSTEPTITTITYINRRGSTE